MISSHLRVALGDRQPFVLKSNTSSGQPSYTGLLIELFEKVIAYNNNSFTYDYYMMNNTGGGSFVDGVWTGIVAELVYGRADVALFPLTRTAARLAAIDCTYSYLDQGLALLVQSTTEAPGALSVLAPFKYTLWGTLLSTVIAVALLFWVLDLYGRWIRARQIRALQATGLLPARKASSRGKKKGKDSHVLTSLMAAAGAPERPQRVSWGGQVLYVVYCFFCLIVLSSYTANLTSFLAVHRANEGISGLQDVIRRSGQEVVVNANSSTLDYFMNSRDSLAMQLRPALRTCAGGVGQCVAAVREGRVAAFVGDVSVLQYQAMQRPCDLAVVGDSFGPGNLVIGLQKGSRLTPLFNAALQDFSEDGTLTDLHRAWFTNLSQCADTAGQQLPDSRLTISQMLGAFVFLALGVLAAFAAETLRNLKWCLLGNDCCCCCRGGSSGPSARDSLWRGRSTTNDQYDMEPRPPSWIHMGRFSRLSLALLGVRKHSHSGDSPPGIARACPYCSGGSSRGGGGGGGGGATAFWGSGHQEIPAGGPARAAAVSAEVRDAATAASSAPPPLEAGAAAAPQPLPPPPPPPASASTSPRGVGSAALLPLPPPFDEPVPHTPLWPLELGDGSSHTVPVLASAGAQPLRPKPSQTAIEMAPPAPPTGAVAAAVTSTTTTAAAAAAAPGTSESERASGNGCSGGGGGGGGGLRQRSVVVVGSSRRASGDAALWHVHSHVAGAEMMTAATAAAAMAMEALTAAAPAAQQQQRQDVVAAAAAVTSAAAPGSPSAAGGAGQAGVLAPREARSVRFRFEWPDDADGPTPAPASLPPLPSLAAAATEAVAVAEAEAAPAPSEPVPTP